MAGHGLDKGSGNNGSAGSDTTTGDRSAKVNPPEERPITEDVYKKPDSPEAQNSTTAAQARIANPSVNQTFKVENGDKPQTISGKVTKDHDGSFKVESPDGKHYQVTTDKDGHAQKLTEINKDTGKPVGEPQRVTAERNGLPTAAEIKKNAEISQPSQTTKHDSHEAKGTEQKYANPQDGKQVAPDKNPQNEKSPAATEKGLAPRDGVEPNKSQSEKGLFNAGAQQPESQKSQIRPDNIQSSSPHGSEKHFDAQRDENKRIADHAAVASREAESQKKFSESAPQLSSTFEQNRKTAEQVLSRSSFEIPQRQQSNLESLNSEMKNADIKRMFETGEKGGTADGIKGRHTDVIDKMDNATSKADASKFLDDKIGLLAAGVATDRANRGAGADGKAGSGGAGGGGASKGMDEGTKATGGKPGEGKSSSGERGVGTGSSDTTRDTARGGKDILPTEPTGKLKAQIENVDKMPTQKSHLADMISKYSEGKFTPKGEKESAIMTAFQSVRFDQLKGLGAWLEDKTRNPFEFKMLDGQTQKAVSRIFELVLATGIRSRGSARLAASRG